MVPETSLARPMGDQQRPRRGCERHARREAVAFSRWLTGQGLPAQEAAARLHLRPRTLQHWQRRWHHDHLAAAARGRPRRVTDAVARTAVVEVLQDVGPAVGVPALKHLFPQVVRSELSSLCRDYRRGLAIQAADQACHLTWRHPGRVWATDFTEPPVLIDGRFGYVLLVRDLASSRQLLALPALAPEARVAVAAFRELFDQFGPPLVLKADNGSSFIAGAFLDLLAGFGVTPLLSPPLTPQYNGSVEAGNGSLKTHARQEALRHGRCIWTSDDLEAACSCANTFARPWGNTGPSPEQRWAARTPITAAERAGFQRARTAARTLVIRERNLHPEDLTRRAVRATVDRAATRRALEGLGYLVLARGPIRPPLKSQIGLKIT